MTSLSKQLYINSSFPSRPNTIKKEAKEGTLRFLPNDVKDTSPYKKVGKVFKAQREFGYYCVSKLGNKFFLRITGTKPYFSIAFAPGFDESHIEEYYDGLKTTPTISKYTGAWIKGYKNYKTFYDVQFTNHWDRRNVLNKFKNTIWFYNGDYKIIKKYLRSPGEFIGNTYKNTKYYGFRFSKTQDVTFFRKTLFHIEKLKDMNDDEITASIKYLQDTSCYKLMQVHSIKLKDAYEKTKTDVKKALNTANALIENFDIKLTLLKINLIVQKCNLIKENKLVENFSKLINKFLKTNVLINTEVYFLGNDDPNHLYRVVGRDHEMSTGSWNEMTNYEVINDDKYYVPVIEVSINNVKPVNETAKDLSIMAGWDIETRPVNMGDQPNPKSEDLIISICTSFHYAGEAKPFCKVGSMLCDACDPLKELDYVIICKTEKEVIRAFIKILRTMKPDFMVDFNGCSFDQPFVMERVIKYNLYEEFASCSCEAPSYRYFDKQTKKYNIKEYYDTIRVKMEAGFNSTMYLMNIPGIIPIDSMVVFRKMNKTSNEYSLNFFLKKNNIELKDDLPYKEMFKIWDEKDPKKLPKILKYCIIDAQRCQELLVKQGIINNERAKAEMSGDVLHGCIHNADGAKVRNVLALFSKNHTLKQYDVSVDMPMIIPCSYGVKQPGGYKGGKVLSPIVGYYEKPISALDYASLYPNCAIDENVSPDCKITDPKLKEELEKQGYRFVEVDTNTWFIQHDDNIQNMGVFSRALLLLFNQRVKLKKQCFHINMCIENINKGMKSGKFDGIEEYYDVLTDTMQERIKRFTSLDENELKEFKQALEDIKYENSKLDAKQLAAKIFMNTFYGESGNSASPLYDKHISATITKIGRKMLVFAKDYMTEKGWKVIGGDTDSVYCLIPDHLIQDILDAWEASKNGSDPACENGSDPIHDKGSVVYKNKQEYWEALVTRAIKLTKVIAIDINNAIKKSRHGQTHLNLAYEEVLMPSIFVRRKHYGGLAHGKVPVFDEENMHRFVRGFRYVKRGVSKFGKTICKEMSFDKFFDPTNPLEGDEIPWKVTHELMEHIFEKKWNLEDFAKTYTYKGAERKGVATAAAKANNEKYNARIEPGDKFNAIVVDDAEKFNIKGNKITTKISDCTVVVDIAKEHNMQVNLMYYMEKEVKNMLGQYLSIYPWFHKPIKHFEELIREREKLGKLEKDFDIEVAKAEADYAVGQANQYVHELMMKYSNTSQITHDIYKKAYKKAKGFFTKQKVYVLPLTKKIKEEIEYAELFKKDPRKLQKALYSLHEDCTAQIEEIPKISVENITYNTEEVTKDIRKKFAHCKHSADASEIIENYKLEKKYQDISDKINDAETNRVKLVQINAMLISVRNKIDKAPSKGVRVNFKGLKLSGC